MYDLSKDSRLWPRSRPTEGRRRPITSRTEFDMLRTSNHVTSRLRPRGILSTMLLGLASGACSDNAPSAMPDTVERETFIEVYVALRHVALRKTSRRVNPIERDSVLAMHDVTEEDLRVFLDVYHTEAEYMRDLWNEVEGRMSLMLEMAEEGSEGDG